VGSMRFMSCPRDPKVLPKVIRFDSSPGRAISRALGGTLDERSYTAYPKENRDGEEIYEIHMRQEPTRLNPGPHPMEKVGVLTYHRPDDAPVEQSSLASGRHRP
jgi:hypothetical protein